MATKSLFISPVPYEWKAKRDDLAEQYNARIISTGDLLRSEIKSQSDLGNSIKKDLDAGKLLAPHLLIELLDKAFFDPEEDLFLIGFPLSEGFTKELANFLSHSAKQIGKVFVMDMNRGEFEKKLCDTYRCNQHILVSGVVSPTTVPTCPECGEDMTRAYDLNNPTLQGTLDQYYKEQKGTLAQAKKLCQTISTEYVSFD